MPRQKKRKNLGQGQIIKNVSRSKINQIIVVVSSSVFAIGIIAAPIIYESSGLKYHVEGFLATRSTRDKLDGNQLDAAKTILDENLLKFPENAELHAEKVRYLMMSRELIWDANQTTQNEVLEHSQRAIQFGNSDKFKHYIAEILLENTLKALEAESNKQYPIAFGDLDFMTGSFWGERLSVNDKIAVGLLSPFNFFSSDKNLASGFVGGGWSSYILLAAEYDLETASRFAGQIERLADKFLKNGHYTSATFLGIISGGIATNWDNKTKLNLAIKILQQATKEAKKDPAKVNAIYKAYSGFLLLLNEHSPDLLKDAENNEALMEIKKSLTEVAVYDLKNLSSNTRSEKEYQECINQIQVKAGEVDFTSKAKLQLKECFGNSRLRKAEQLASSTNLEQAIEVLGTVPKETDASNNARLRIDQMSNSLREQAEVRQRAEEKATKQEQLEKLQGEHSQLESQLNNTREKITQIEEQAKKILEEPYRQLPFHRHKVRFGGYDAATGGSISKL